MGLTEKDRAVLNAEVEAELRAPHQSLTIGYDNDETDPRSEAAEAPRR